MTLLTRVVAAAVCVGVVSLSASSADPTLWLSQARAAIGRDVATGTVTALRIRGSKQRHLGSHTVDFSWETYWQAPDKFVQVNTQFMSMGPMGNMSTTRRSGFNGGQEIEHVLSDLPMPQAPRNAPNALVPMHKRALVQLLLPLLASVDPLAGVAPFTIVAADPSVLPRAGLNLVALAAPDGARWHLWLDATTHLPAALSWVDSPIATTSTTTTMAVTTTVRVPAGQVPSRTTPALPPMPPPPPTGVMSSGSDKVPYELTLTDYRTDKGVTWPRRITVTVDGAPWETLRISRYDVNPKINPRTFEVRK